MITSANPSSQVSFMHELQAPSMDKISWIQRDTAPYSLVRKIFCRPPFSKPCRPLFRYPWVVKRAEKMCGNSYTPVPARARRFSATPAPLVRCQSAMPHPCAAQPPAIPARSGRNRIAPHSRAGLLHPCAPSLIPRSRCPSLPNCRQMTQ